MRRINIPVKFSIIIFLGVTLGAVSIIYPVRDRRHPGQIVQTTGVVAGEFTGSGPGYPRVAMQSQRGDETNTYLDRAALGDVFMVNGYMPLNDLQYVKSKNPNIKVMAFIGSFCGIRLPIEEDPEHGFNYTKCDTDPVFHEKWFFDCELYDWLAENDGWLYSETGEHYVGFVARDGTHLNMFCMAEGCPVDGQGKSLAEFYSELINSMIFQNSFGYEKVDLWDGTMMDCAGDMSWTIDAYNDGNEPDFNRDSIGDDFDPNMKTEMISFFQKVRQYAGDMNAFLVNSVQWGQQYLNGFQIENTLRRGSWNCPGGNPECLWQTNMFYTFLNGNGHGYLTVEDLYYDEPFRVGMPHIGWSCGTEEAPAACCNGQQCEEGETPMASDLIEFNRYKRFAIGTVALGDGYLSFNWNNSGSHAHTEAWPIPENYNGLPGTPHYLGQALNDCKVVEDDGLLTACRELEPGSIKVYRRDFEDGIVLVNPSDSEKIVNLEDDYKVLDVVEYFTVSGGSVISQVAIPAFDSIILLREHTPEIQAISDQIISEGGEITVPFVATDEDCPAGDCLTFSWSSEPTADGFGTISDNGDGTGNLVFNPDYLSADEYQITVTVSDNSSSPHHSNTKFTLSVSNTNRPPSLLDVEDKTIHEMDNLEFNIIATDQDLDDALTLSAEDMPLNAIFVDNGDRTGIFTWQPNINQSGVYLVTFTVMDNYGYSDSIEVQIDVEDGVADCSPNWQCTDWSICLNSLQYRTCTDLNNCGTDAGKPTEVETCDSTPPAGVSDLRAE
ncbi:MAG: Ig-like domain-containing protein [Patescibacteria group bacterium]|nr:Ig-like domain-containing protein [Patescibacteria group bacterium]